jgi:hypothetical protein
MNFDEFVAMLKVSSMDSLDMYDDRLASTFGTVASVERLNALLHRGGASVGDSQRGVRRGGVGSLAAHAASAGGDDSQHSTTSTDRTGHWHGGMSDWDASQHGAAGGGAPDGSSKRGHGPGSLYYRAGGNSSSSQDNMSAAGAVGAWGGAWRFDVGVNGSGGASGTDTRGGLNGALVSKPVLQSPIAPAPGGITFRFDVGGPQAKVAPAVTAPVWRFDVAGPHAPPSAAGSGASNQLPPPPQQQVAQSLTSPEGTGAMRWRFDVGGGAAGVGESSGGQFDGRHHGSSLYKNSLAPCRVAERSLHGGMPRMLAPVKE